MRNHPWSISLLIMFALISFGLIMRPTQPLAAELQQMPYCIFLPLIPGASQDELPGADAQPACVQSLEPTPTVSVTPTETITPEPDISLTGALQLRPEHQLIPQTRLPQRYTVVLDVSGSMSANFAGECNNQGQNVQCANGAPGAPAVSVSGTGPTYWWNIESERRIYVAKQAIIRLISLLNIEGTASYTNTRPPDQLTLVLFNDGSISTMRYPSAWDSPEMSDAAALQNLVLNANSPYAAEAYRTSGGTSGAAGLYRAYLTLQNAPASVTHTDGKTYDYDEHVLFISDGVSNYFLRTTSANLSGGTSSTSTYPAGHFCRSLGPIELAHNAECQTTEFGGAYNGLDRPLTQMAKVSTENLQQIADRPQNVFVITLGNVPPLGLQTGVATTSDHYFSAPNLVKYADGSSNIDRIMDLLAIRNGSGACYHRISPSWVDSMANENLPVGVGEMIGEVKIVGAAGLFVAPVIRDAATNRLSYAFRDLPSGDYELQASLFYQGADAQTREYSLLSSQEHSYLKSTIAVSIPAESSGAITQPLYLRLNGNVCPQN